MTIKETLKEMIRETEGRINRYEGELVKAKIMERFATRKAIALSGSKSVDILGAVQKQTKMLESQVSMEKELLEFLQTYE